MRRLGSPVIEINVDDDQVSDRIDEALQYYQEYHSDAIVKTYLKHVVTATDIANEYLTIADSVTSIVKVLPLGFGSSNWNSDNWQIMAQTMRDFQVGGSIAEYEMSQQNISLMQHRMGTAEGVRYNRHQNKLHIEVKWGTEVKEGSYIVAEAYNIVDPSEYSSIYNDMFLKQYSTALIKQQWGANLIKFEGMQLPGGVTMNGRQLYDDATEEIRLIREYMQVNYEEPVDFMIG
tara:strand:+ start:1408 stop:2106 length:699 start_codon:yes stop_codon:yes gene_type:complete